MVLFFVLCVGNATDRNPRFQENPVTAKTPDASKPLPIRPASSRPMDVLDWLSVLGFTPPSNPQALANLNHWLNEQYELHHECIVAMRRALRMMEEGQGEQDTNGVMSTVKHSNPGALTEPQTAEEPVDEALVDALAMEITEAGLPTRAMNCLINHQLCGRPAFPYLLQLVAYTPAQLAKQVDGIGDAWARKVDERLREIHPDLALGMSITPHLRSQVMRKIKQLKVFDE